MTAVAECNPQYRRSSNQSFKDEYNSQGDSKSFQSSRFATDGCTNNFRDTSRRQY
jgi:hypothetical protein